MKQGSRLFPLCTIWYGSLGIYILARLGICSSFAYLIKKFAFYSINCVLVKNLIPPAPFWDTPVFVGGTVIGSGK